MKNVIGDTPLLFSDYLSSFIGCTVLIKAEYSNPGASSKDRIALAMIEAAELSGNLRPGGTIVEASSGNTAIGIAWIARKKGYRCRIFLSKSCSPEKLKVLKELGAETEVCETSGGPDDPFSCQSRAEKYAQATNNAFYCDQYFNPINEIAHYSTTGPEIWRQSNGRITHFLSGVGTGGTISGVGRFLKSKNSNIQIYGVDPKGSILTDFFNNKPVNQIPKGAFHIEGIGRHFIPGNLNLSCIDRFIQVGDTESAEAAYQFRQETSFEIGFSSAAVLAALFNIGHSLKHSDIVVVFFADRGDRYQSKLYCPNWLSKTIFSSEDWRGFYKKHFRQADGKSE
jgi:cystathionine beta-synthase